MLRDMEQLKRKFSGKSYLVRARHIIWNEIVNEDGKIWDYFKTINDEILLKDEAYKVINKSF